MKFLGNILWLIFGGLECALGYFTASLALMITIVGIPFGVETLKLGGLSLGVADIQDRPAVPVAFRCQGDSYEQAAGLYPGAAEHHLVHLRRVAGMDFPCILRDSAVHHYHRYSLGKAAFQDGRAGSASVRTQGAGGSVILAYEKTLVSSGQYMALLPGYPGAGIRRVYP